MGYIVGIDPGTINAGIGILKDGEYLASEQLSLGRNKPLTERLYDFGVALLKLGEQYPDAAWYLEDGFVGDNRRTSLIIGMARGIVLGIAGGYGIQVHMISPKDVKRAACGRGNASKEQVQQMVTAICKPDHVLGPDEADALATALAGWALQKEAKFHELGKTNTNTTRICKNNERITKRFRE